MRTLWAGICKCASWTRWTFGPSSIELKQIVTETPKDVRRLAENFNSFLEKGEQPRVGRAALEQALKDAEAFARRYASR